MKNIKQKKRKGISFSEMPSQGCILSRKLILCDSTNGALTCAGTAADALICIDFELSVAHADSANGAGVNTSAASNALVSNLMSHGNLLISAQFM